MRRKMSANRVLVYAIAVLIILLTCIGCQQSRTRSNSGKDTGNIDNFGEEKEKPLVIFDIGGSTIAQDFQLAYPDIECEIVLINANDSSKLENNFLNAAHKHGEPDIIIDSAESGRMQYWIEQNYVLDISDYFDRDDTYSNDVYYPGVESVGRVGGQLYAFPLGLETTYMTIRHDVWEESGLSKLPENYTSLDLLYAMEEEMDYWMGQDAEEYRWVLPLIQERVSIRRLCRETVLLHSLDFCIINLLIKFFWIRISMCFGGL